MPKEIIVSVQEMVGERKFTVEGTETELIVRFGKPFKDELGDFRCEFQFIGACEHPSGFTQGVDAIEALDNAF